ncbi:short-chain dehydrogenase/reductase-like protein [Lophiotrema nucula]|uniref:Short-chain dehydrogenase/reductase-like protein n=1 Tax=Lophiotrema nucula TaxID=690887 RepID=A0A6A5YRX1_9PLEO|nr:short-chain dehydrogenase/reductase-like protein [Lophiotrema nucula]
MAAGRLANKVAIITGSASGIGRATALAYAREGARIVCSDIREEPRELRKESSDLTTMQELESIKADFIFQKADTTKSEDVEALVKKAVEKYGRLDIMVNNAGVAFDDYPVWDFPEEFYDTTLAVNTKGVFLGTKYASKQMISQDPHPSGDRGWIINLSSVLGLNGTPGTVAYSASKHGVMGLTKAAAWDCAKFRIHVNAICPGYTATSMTSGIWDREERRAQLEKMHPFRGLGEAEDLARAAVFLASEDARWVTGVGLPVDGGYSCM